MKTTSKNTFGKLLAKTMVWVRPLVTKPWSSSFLIINDCNISFESDGFKFEFLKHHKKKNISIKQ